MSRPYRGVLFDLFGTLIIVDASVLPEVTVDGRTVRATLPYWAPLVDAVCPGVDPATLARAFWAVSTTLAHERAATHVEVPARERFRRTLVSLGCPDEVAELTAPALVRVHMRAIAETTRFPAGHRRLLEETAGCGPVGVVTNFDDTAGAYEILERHGIRRLVGTVVVSEAIGRRKPHGTLLAIALRELELAPGAAVMVGDNLVEDVGAARAVGADAVWIDVAGRGLPDDGPRPNYVVDVLEDVRPILAGPRARDR